MSRSRTTAEARPSTRARSLATALLEAAAQAVPGRLRPDHLGSAARAGHVGQVLGQPAGGTRWGWCRERSFHGRSRYPAARTPRCTVYERVRTVRSWNRRSLSPTETG